MAKSLRRFLQDYLDELPETLVARLNLGILYLNDSRFDEAFELLEPAVAGMQEVLGRTHRAPAMHRLLGGLPDRADTLSYRKAEECHERGRHVAEHCQSVQGQKQPQHPTFGRLRPVVARDRGNQHRRSTQSTKTPKTPIQTTSAKKTR